MKKVLSILFLSIALFLNGCSNNSGDDKISIVATSFPEYDWIRQIVGDSSSNIELTLLIDSGVDIHNYEPSTEDILKISSSDLFIHTGGESDDWVDDVLEEAANETMRVINLIDTLGYDVLNASHSEQAPFSNEESNDEDHGHDDHDGHDHDGHEDEHLHADEHVWLSLRNAIVFCEVILDEISQLDPENSYIYEENTIQYINELNDLDLQYKTAVDESIRDTVIITDRFPFAYMMDDYEINYYAAFDGCSAETEASFETIATLSGKIVELDTKNIVILENGLEELANTVISTVNELSSSMPEEINILSMNSIQSISQQDIEDGVTYISVMEKNLETLKIVLGE